MRSGRVAWLCASSPSSSVPTPATTGGRRWHDNQGYSKGLGISLKLPFLSHQRSVSLFEILTAPLVLGQWDHLPEIRLGQPLQLPPESGSALAEVLLAGLPLLRQPLAAVRPPQRVRDGLGMTQNLAQILPDDLIELLCRGVARGAFLLRRALSLVELARAHVVSLLAVVVLPEGFGDRYGSQHALSAAHQSPQEVLVGLVVAPGEGLVPGEFLFREVELLLAHHRRHLGHEGPLLLWQRLGGVVGMSYGVGCRAPDPGGTVAHAPGVDPASVDGVGQYPAQGGRAPRLPAPWSGDAHLPKVPGDTEEARSRLEVGREDLRDRRGLRLVETHPGRIARSVGVDPKTVGGVRPGQQKPRFVLGQPSPAHPLGEQRPLVLGHRSADLQEQLVVRLGAHRSLHELHPAASLLELLDEDHLVNVVARQPIWGKHHDDLELPQARLVAQGVEGGSLQRSAAVTVVAEDILFRQLPCLLLGVFTLLLQLLLDRLEPDLSRGRDPDVCRHPHGTPPCRLRPERESARFAGSTARWPGKPGPSVASRPGVSLFPDVRVSAVSSSPPCRVIPAGGYARASVAQSVRRRVRFGRRE